MNETPSGVQNNQASPQKHPASEQEHCPSGYAPHAFAAKLDAGKPRAALVLGDFAHALQAVAAVGTFGARKYTDGGWLHVPNGVQRYSDAMLRHWLSESMGQAHDEESSLLHAAHTAWNALARLELMLREAKPAATLTCKHLRLK